jgi:hypothetical protein
LASDCISQPGSPVSTTQHVKAAYEQSTVGPTQVHSTWCALLQDIELVPQYPYFGFQPPPLPEAAATGRKAGQLRSSTAIMF